jgi:hypothetical protein
MDKKQILIVIGSYANTDAVRETLPTILSEIAENDAALIVHDSTEKRHGQKEKWGYLREMEEKHDFFLILSSNMSMAHARNMCLQLGQQLYLPDYIAVMEDDHGFRPGFLGELISTMKTYYGQVAPNGMRFGLFSGCASHRRAKDAQIAASNHFSPRIDEKTDPGAIGGVNSCFRAAPAHHWNHVLIGYDTDEYLISTHQTKNLNFRNYHKGFTNMLVQGGDLMFDVDNESRGWSKGKMSGLWDNDYAASDPRAKFDKK